MSSKKPLTPHQQAVARRLKALWESKKEALGLKQDTVAEFLGYGSQGAVSHYLNGYNAIGFEAMFRWADLLRVHPYEIDDHFRFRLPHDLRLAVDAMVPDTSNNHRLLVYDETHPTVPRALHEPGRPNGLAVRKHN